jgi:hypothetical protein
MAAVSQDFAARAPLEIDAADPSVWQDMPAATRRWREQHPLAHAPLLGAWFVLRHADVLRLLGDERLASGYGGLGEGPSGRVASGLLVNQSGERHARLRRLVAHAFTPRQIERARRAMRVRIAERLAALPCGGAVDFQREVADPLARLAICDQLGVPAADAADFAETIAAVLPGLVSTTPREERARADAAAEHLFATLAELVARRRREPGEGLLDALLVAEDGGDRLAPAELETLVLSLLAGGVDTVRSFLGILAALVLARPELCERLRESPELVPGAVEEALRFEPPLAGLPRVAIEAIELHGVAIPAGSPVLLAVLSANRDPRRFPDPDRFEPLRDASAHLTFGRGTHFCVGAALARMEAQELLLALTGPGAPRLALEERPRWVPFSPARRLEGLRVAVAWTRPGSG